MIQPLYDLLKDPKHWTKGSYAKDAEGLPVSSASPDAVCWCLGGAISKVSDNIEDANAYFNRLEEILTEMYDAESIEEFNDDLKTTHADVLKVIEEA